MSSFTSSHVVASTAAGTRRRGLSPRIAAALTGRPRVTTSDANEVEAAGAAAAAAAATTFGDLTLHHERSIVT